MGRDLDELYDDATSARLGGAGGRSGGDGDARARTRLAAGALVATLGLGLAEVYDPEPRRPQLLEVDPGEDDGERRPVTLFFVPGDPRATVAVVRPWLLAGRPAAGPAPAG